MARSPEKPRFPIPWAVLVPLLAAPSTAALQGGKDPEQAAAELLEKAEREVSKGRHARALSTYRRIVRRYPETAAGEVAERRTRPNAYIGVADIHRSGPSENRVDIVLMGDGFELDDLDSFDDIVADSLRIFERNRVFEEYLGYINLIRASVVSEETGVDGIGGEHSTALGGRVSEGLQDQVTVDRELVREVLAELPEQDGFAVVLVRRGTLGTGGGGLAAVAEREFDTLIHEWGHAFGNLGDEYSTNTGFRGDPSVRANVSNTSDPELVPWAHWLEAKVRGIGVYEGADGRVRGAWKPTTRGCIMGSGAFFCPVCREALVLRIHRFVDPIEDASPDPRQELRLGRSDDPLELVARVMRPATHALEVSWWLLPEAEAPPPSVWDPEAASLGRRGQRGPLAEIAREPDRFSRRDPRGVHRFSLSPRDVEPGRFRLILRVRDPAKPRGQKGPWVLRDRLGLLESERSWGVVVE